MGGDGGSIPGRADVVRVKGYAFKRNLGGMGYDPNTLVAVGDGKFGEDERRRFRLTRCALTEEPLDAPVVADRMGLLYSKEAVIKGLMDKSLPPEVSKYLKKLKDIKQIVPPLSETATPFPVWDPEIKRLQCPLSGTQFSETGEYFISWICGCLFSSKAAASVDPEWKSKRVCPVCGLVSDEFLEIVARKTDGKREATPHKKRRTTSSIRSVKIASL